MVVHPDVVANEVPVDAVFAALLLIEQDVGGWGRSQTRYTTSKTERALSGVKVRKHGGSGGALTFLPHLDVLADSDVFPPRLLDDSSVAVELPLSHLLQQEKLQEKMTLRHRTTTPRMPLVRRTDSGVNRALF